MGVKFLIERGAEYKLYFQSGGGCDLGGYDRGVNVLQSQIEGGKRRLKAASLEVTSKSRGVSNSWPGRNRKAREQKSRLWRGTHLTSWRKNT